MPPDLRAGLEQFLFVLALRHPSNLQYFVDHEQERISSIRQALCERGSDAAEFIGSMDRYFATAKDRAMFFILLLAKWGPSRYSPFRGMPSVMVDLATAGQLFTNDRPMTSMPNIGVAEAMHVLPLSPSRVLLMSWDVKKLDFWVQLRGFRLLSICNLLTILFARQYVYAFEKQDEDAVFKYLGKAAPHKPEQYMPTLIEARDGRLRVGVLEPFPCL